MKKTRWLLWLLVIAFVWLLISRFTELTQLWQTLLSGNPYYILAAAALQVVYYLTYTALYQAAFAVVEVKSRFRELVPVMFASVFMNVAAPVGGAGGPALFVEDARRRGESPVRAAAGTLLVIVADFATFFFILIVGMAYLFAAQDLRSYEVVAAILMILLTTGLVGVLFLGVWQPELLLKLLRGVRFLINSVAAWFGRRDLIPQQWVTHTANDFIEAALAIAANPRRLGRALVVAFLLHAVDIFSMFMVFLAFGQNPSPGMLVAGYAMMVLFWVISLPPQGIGVVEGMMMLVFTSLGVPAGASAAITLSFRGLTLWLPILVGFVLLRTLRIFNPRGRTFSDSWGARSAALLLGLLGFLNVGLAVLPAEVQRSGLLLRFLTPEVQLWARLTGAMAGFALIFLADGLRRRKRVAWVMSMAVLSLSIVCHILKGLDYEPALLTFLVLLWMLYLRPHFHARSEPPTYVQGLQTLFAALVFTLLYGTIGFYMLDTHFNFRFDLASAFLQTLGMFVFFDPRQLRPLTDFGAYFVNSVYVVAMFTFGYSLVMLLRPAFVPRPLPVGERQRAAALVQTFGRSTQAALALLPDKNYFFSSGGSLLAYALKDQVALVLGDPIGPPQDLPAALAEFRSYCAERDWSVAFFLGTADALPVYQSAGLHGLGIGGEEVVDLATLDFEAVEYSGLIAAHQRLSRFGYRTEVLLPPFEDGLLEELRPIHHAWMTMTQRMERRFWLAWYDEAYLRGGPLLLVRDREGACMAFASLRLGAEQAETGLHLLRFRPEMEHGGLDFLLFEWVQWARSQGVRLLNLGFSPHAEVLQQEGEEEGNVQRSLHYLMAHLGTLFEQRDLAFLRAKLRNVTWQTRFLVYEQDAHLPIVTLALMRLDSGDDLFGRSTYRRQMRRLILPRRK